jgi:hypothetical protein
VKAKHHFLSSVVVGGVLYYVTGSANAAAGVLVGGFLIDADHLLDQLWSIKRASPHMGGSRPRVEDAAPSDPAVGGSAANSTGRDRSGTSTARSRGASAWYHKYVRRRKLVRLPLIFHSYELLALIALTALMLRTWFITGLLAGYVLHLSLDFIRHAHELRSPLFYSLLYRLSRGFKRERLIRKEYL